MNNLFDAVRKFLPYASSNTWNRLLYIGTNNYKYLKNKKINIIKIDVHEKR